MRYLVYILKRLVALVPVLLGISFIVFFLIRLIPGDPASTLLGAHATPETVRALRTQLGLTEPLWRQYLTFLGHLLRGNLGYSYVYSSSVVSLMIAVPLAVLAAVRRNGIADNIIRAVPVVGLGLPSFWLGIMLILVFGLKLGWFPVAGYGNSLGEHLRGIVLPGITVALALAPILIRSLRASLLEVLESDYVTTARSKGLPERRVLVHHALRNGIISTVSVLGVNVGFLVGGTLLVERVYAVPGIGQLMIDSIFQRDFPVVQAVTLVFAVMVVLVYLLTDVAHALLDPRVRFE
jgi:peptide/nickel transport system permease protein